MSLSRTIHRFLPGEYRENDDGDDNNNTDSIISTTKKDTFITITSVNEDSDPTLTNSNYKNAGDNY